MAFRILKKVKDGGSTLNSLYQFVPTTIDGVSYYLEFNTKEEVDEYVEEQLNLGLPKTSLEVVAPMKYTVSASIDEEECGCGVPSTNPVPAEKPYKIIANPVGGVVEKGTKITFIIDADKAKFQRLLIDDSEVNSNYYTVTAGSTIVTLAAIYADTLALGNHTIEFIFTDGKASDKFEIVETPTDDNPSDEPSEEPTTPSDPSGDEGNEGGENEGNTDNTPETPEEGDNTEDGSGSENTNPSEDEDEQNPPSTDGDNTDINNPEDNGEESTPVEPIVYTMVDGMGNALDGASVYDDLVEYRIHAPANTEFASATIDGVPVSQDGLSAASYLVASEEMPIIVCFQPELYTTVLAPGQHTVAITLSDGGVATATITYQ